MGKKKKSDSDIVVSFVGTSKTEVTGSCVTISYPKNNGERGLVVIECGLSQGEPTIEKQYNANKRMIEDIGKDVIQNASHIFLTHGHCDHIANLPIFNDDNGFKGKILGSKKTIEIGKQLIKDSVYIHSKNIEYLKSLGKKVQQLYTEVQMYQMFEHMEYVNVGEEVIIDDNLKVLFTPNSHVVGATSILLTFRKPSGNIKTICYSGDLGSNINKEFQPFLTETRLPNKCNLFISEATYNNENRSFNKKDCVKEREELKQLIIDSIQQGKRLLFATFSFSRSQLLLCMFYEWFKDEEWFKDIPIVVDGLLMNKINDTYLNVLEGEELEYFRNVLSMPNIKFNRTYDGTKAVLSKRTPGIYLASSGFCENGRITTYLPIFLSNSKDVCILTGYSGGIGSVGFKILNPEQKTITFQGKQVIGKRALINQLKTFSSHIQYSELLKLFSEMNCEKIIVHHTSEDGKEKFCNEAKEYIKSKGKTTPVIPVGKGSYQFVL